MQEETEYINVYGARVHNLKDIDAEIPRNSLTVITGLSGSGKSSLAFDTIFAEGQRRYIETFSAYARNFLGNLERPDVDKITGLSPVNSYEQKTTKKNGRITFLADLPVDGKYYVKELQAPDGFVTTEEEQEFLQGLEASL